MFTLLVPGTARILHRVIDTDYHADRDAEARVDAAIPVLSEAAGAPIVGVVGSPEPLRAVQDALNLLGFDEAIISMLPLRESLWFRLDLPRKVRALGVPVTEVICSERQFDGTAA
jgi:GABA permease